ncbi:MAG: hypothetical protein QOG38_729 [Hyphomicrobiales bacterium]|jgi:hypothetical protein|nr:hypothetical protein [Hyphomicrobiales bacterium]
MRRSEVLGRAALLAALGATALTGACTDMYLDRRDSVSFAAGDAAASNAVTHMVDPWPVVAGNRNITYDGDRMQAAAERYRTGKTTPLSSASTSSVKYDPVVLAPAPK